jgi:hypothetical protein
MFGRQEILGDLRIQSDLWSRSNQAEERNFVTTISRFMSGHCSIRAHLERFKVVGDPISVCMMNYETVDHFIWKCSRFEDERRQLAAVNIKEGTPTIVLLCIKGD